MKGPKLAVLLVAAAIGVGVQNYIFFSNAPERPRPVRGDGSAESSVEETDPVATIDELDAEELTAWFASWDGTPRNPFLAASEGRLPKEFVPRPDVAPLPLLSGTLWSESRRVAWIDGKPRSEGDWVGPHQVARIHSKHVVLAHEDGRISLSLQPYETPEHADDPR